MKGLARNLVLTGMVGGCAGVEVMPEKPVVDSVQVDRLGGDEYLSCATSFEFATEVGEVESRAEVALVAAAVNDKCATSLAEDGKEKPGFPVGYRAIEQVTRSGSESAIGACLLAQVPKEDINCPRRY